MLKIKSRGFSLIEVIIVLAISATILGIVIGVYAQRQNVTADDGAEQIASALSTVRNEAQQGLGPTIADTNPNYPAKGETLFGEAVQFSNGLGCANSQPCMIVYKLKQSVDGKDFTAYESYQIANPGGVEYYNKSSSAGGNPTNCTSIQEFLSCISTSTSSLDVSDRDFLIVIRNGTGSMSYYPTAVGQCESIGSGPIMPVYPVACSKQITGNLRQGLVYRKSGTSTPGTTDLAVPASGDKMYYLNINMTGGNAITVTKP